MKGLKEESWKWIPDLLPVFNLQECPEGPHDGEDDETSEVVSLNVLVVVALGQQSFQHVYGLADVHALQHLHKQHIRYSSLQQIRYF